MTETSKCTTVGCRSVATHAMTWRDRSDGTLYTDNVCEPCGQEYVRRPALRATLEPLCAEDGGE